MPAREILSLGQRSLKFFSTPFVHWPETIMTYEESHRILFSCDAFGGYGALSGSVFDDECRHFDFYEKEALRYYANIVANYSSRVLSAIAKLANVPVDIVAPSHGLVWRKEPQRIIELYKKWAEALTMAAHKRILNRKAAYFGSYGWSGGALKEVKKIIEPAKWDLRDSFEFVGSPKEEDLKKGEEFGRNFAELIKSSA